MKKVLSRIAIVATVLMFSAVSAMAGTVGTIALKTGDGKDFTNETIKEKKVLFIVAQTACGQCRKEIADISEQFDKISGKGLVFTVLVDINQERALEYYKKKDYKVPVVLDPNFTIAGMADIAATPATIIVDAKGNITYTKTGYRPGQLEEILENF